MPEPRKRLRAVILTALSVEYQAVRAHLRQNPINEIVHERGTIYEVGTFQGSTIDWEVCLTEVGPGNAASSFEAERAIATFGPAVVLFVGIAGGLKDVSIGDVVLSTKIYGYEAGKAKTQFEVRPDVGESTYDLEQRGRAEARKLNWLSRISSLSPNLSPRVFVGPIAAGEKVIASRRSAIFRFLRKAYGDALAVEMEGRGFLKVIRANHQVFASVIRGISDLLEDKSHVELSGSQELAATHAAAFAFELLFQFDPLQRAHTSDDSLGDAQVRYVVLISGQFDEQNIAFAKAAFEFLKSKIGDASMVLEKISAGSIKLNIKGQFSGFQRLRVLMSAGSLSLPNKMTVLSANLSPTEAGGAPLRESVSDNKIKFKAYEFTKEEFSKMYRKLILTAGVMLRRRKGMENIQAEDVVNEVIVQYVSADSIKPNDIDIEKYLLGRVRSTIHAIGANERRHSTVQLAVDDEMNEAQLFVDMNAQPGAALEERSQLERARQVLGRDKAVLKVFDEIVKGETSADVIAERLGVPRHSVLAARRKIRRELEKLSE
jgi:nucleoside phosphorylase